MTEFQGLELSHISSWKLICLEGWPHWKFHIIYSGNIYTMEICKKYTSAFSSHPRLLNTGQKHQREHLHVMCSLKVSLMFTTCVSFCLWFPHSFLSSPPLPNGVSTSSSIKLCLITILSHLASSQMYLPHQNGPSTRHTCSSIFSMMISWAPMSLKALTEFSQFRWVLEKK
jgi:hypothetical protein